MYGNIWGGEMDVREEVSEQKTSRNIDFDRASIAKNPVDETHQRWLLGPPAKPKKKKYVDMGCIVCSTTACKWTIGFIVVAFAVIGLPIMIGKLLPRHPPPPPPPDNYTVALQKVLLFFNAQKSGKLPEDNGIPWRGDSGLKDGSDIPGGLVGGYYDSGENTKFHFPLAFSMTMLSWSVIEYKHKYHAIGEYDHIRDLIKWGIDYLLLTFDSSANSTDRIYSQVGGSTIGSTEPSDSYCWERPEDMDYPRPVQTTTVGPDLAGEMAAAIAAASIVFHDNPAYSKTLVVAAETVYAFARDFGRRWPYSRQNPYIEPYYNSTGYFDEYMWGAAWLFYATGNVSYLSLATDLDVAANADVIPGFRVMSWDNKLPAAMLILTRMRLFLSPGYPYEDMLGSYHNVTGLTMCSFLQQYNVFSWTRGGLILLSNDPQGRSNLQYVVNAAFLASIFADYLNANDIPGWYCGPSFFTSSVLKDFATSQVNYILGCNPLNTSYLVGYGSKYPQHVHHRGASIPVDNTKYSCTSGWEWRDASTPNPNNITGMVSGPDQDDNFEDVRANYNYTQITMAGNAGLVAALVSLTSSGGVGVNRNSIFSSVPPLSPPSPPPPAPWKP